jgi:hypothetical protein
LVVSVGQAVEFRNDEERPIEHNVFSHSPAMSFDLGLYRPGVTKTVVFDKPGLVRLYCSIHRYMDGAVYVCPTPFFARVADEGGYTIRGVPPGEYSVRTFQLRRRFREQARRVTITEGQEARADFRMGRN